MITVVSGLPRSGTSLMMKMLVAGGMYFYADEFPVFETQNILALRNGYTDWLADCEGACVKILEPERNPLPAGYEYQIIWMRRKWYAMAKSQIKCLNEFEPGPVRMITPESINELKRRTEVGLKMCRALGSVLVVHFEDLLEKPKRECARVSRFIKGIDLDAEAMRQIILHRKASNAPTILEKEWGFSKTTVDRWNKVLEGGIA